MSQEVTDCPGTAVTLIPLPNWFLVATVGQDGDGGADFFHAMGHASWGNHTFGPELAVSGGSKTNQEAPSKPTIVRIRSVNQEPEIPSSSKFEFNRVRDRFRADGLPRGLVPRELLWNPQNRKATR